MAAINGLTDSRLQGSFRYLVAKNGQFDAQTGGNPKVRIGWVVERQLKDALRRDVGASQKKVIPFRGKFRSCRAVPPLDLGMPHDANPVQKIRIVRRELADNADDVGDAVKYESSRNQALV